MTDFLMHAGGLFLGLALLCLGFANHRRVRLLGILFSFLAVVMYLSVGLSQ